MNNYKVTSIKKKQTYDWLLHKHYAKRIPQIIYAFGLFYKNKLVGICTFGYPPSPALCIGVCGKKYKNFVLELNRLCINDNLKNNSLSFFVSKCLKLIPKPKILVSYADTSQNHNGYIYQATNWIYTGLSAKRSEIYDIDNPNKHSKTVSQNLNIKNIGYRRRPQKHRYIYFLGTKKEKKQFLKNLNYKIKKYPKGLNKKYDTSYNPQTQQDLFI